MTIEQTLKWAKMYPEQGQDPISVEACIGADYYQQEVEKVFKKTWLKVGRIEELPKKGDYKVKKLHFAKTSVILIRGKDDVVRGFHNTCSHRGNKVIVETGEETFGSSKAAVVTCRFHGWVYDAKGSLVNVPEEESFYPCFAKEDNGLTPINTEVWEGFIFINLSESPENTLKDYLAGYGQHFEGYPFGEIDDCYTYETYLDCNWKIAHDAFAEAYHVATIHAGSFPNVFTSGLQNVKLFNEHRTCAVHLAMPEPTPVALLQQSRADASLANSRGASILPAGINPERRSDFSFELSVCFPNILIHVAEGIWFTHQFWPIAHNKTLWEGRYYVKKPKTNSERWAIEYAQVLQRNAWLEDTATLENTHDALESRSKKVMHLQDEEILVRHQYNTIAEYLK